MRRTAPLLLAALALLLAARPPDEPATILPPPPDADLLLVQPREGLALASLEAGLAEAGFDVRAAPALAGAARVAVPPGAEPLAVAERIAATGLARGVEADAQVTATTQERSRRFPADDYYPKQAPYLEAIHAPEAWAYQTGNPDVVIAVVDSGVDLDHPDLAGRIAYARTEQADGRDEDGSGCVDDTAGCSFVSLETADPSCGYTTPPPHPGAGDDEGHGTFVAGIAAATGDNGDGVSGVAWDARILPVKVLDCTAMGRVAAAAAGIRYAARRGADVINVSFGTRRDSRVLREAVEEAIERGAVVVASAGNEAAPLVTFPAAYPGVIAVGASGRFASTSVDYTQTAEFTNFGPRVDLLAPGRWIVSTVPEGSCGVRGWWCDGGPYAIASGTSFATPLVAGAAALVRAQYGPLSSPLVAALLDRSADGPAGTPGLLNLAATLERPLYTLGAPGTGRAGEGMPAGPAERTPGQGALPPEDEGPASGQGGAATATPTATPRTLPPWPLPANTGHGVLPRTLRRAAGCPHPSAPRRRRASARSS